MNDIVTAIGGIVLLITILGCIPYGIWLIYSLAKRKWKRVGFQIAIPLAVYACLAGASAISGSKAHAEYLVGLYDTEVVLGPAIFEYNSDRAFNGDGYSISVYDLPTKLRKRFESADNRLLNEYPKHPSYRNHWQFEHWREAPFDEKFMEHLNFALSSYDSGKASGLTSCFEAIRKALARKGTFYALFYYKPGGYIGDIDFFVVDLVEGRLYSINHNT
jgi:hypothetical protein